MAFEKKRLRVNGIEITVLVAGTGPDVLYLHGAGTTTGFDALLPIARHARLLVPLHPGFGSSQDDPSVEDVHDLRRHYLDLADQLGLTRFVLAGHSMGGYLAASFAIDHPERVAALVLASPIGLRLPELPTVDLFALPPDKIVEHLTQKPEIFLAGTPDPLTPEFLADQYREMTSAARLLWAGPYDRKLDRWLHRIRMPALVLWGEADRLVPSGQCAEWVKRLDNAESRVFPGLGHLLFDESPEVAEEVARFAARVTG